MILSPRIIMVAVSCQSSPIYLSDSPPKVSGYACLSWSNLCLLLMSYNAYVIVFSINIHLRIPNHVKISYLPLGLLHRWVHLRQAQRKSKKEEHEGAAAVVLLLKELLHRHRPRLHHHHHRHHHRLVLHHLTLISRPQAVQIRPRHLLHAISTQLFRR